MPRWNIVLCREPVPFTRCEPQGDVIITAVSTTGLRSFFVLRWLVLESVCVARLDVWSGFSSVVLANMCSTRTSVSMVEKTVSMLGASLSPHFVSANSVDGHVLGGENHNLWSFKRLHVLRFSC